MGWPGGKRRGGPMAIAVVTGPVNGPEWMYSGGGGRWCGGGGGCDSGSGGGGGRGAGYEAVAVVAVVAVVAAAVGVEMAAVTTGGSGREAVVNAGCG